jgi:hypothetical protein
VRERGLAHARNVFDQQVAAGEQAGERKAQMPVLAEDDPVQIAERRLDQLEGALLAAGRLLMKRRAHLSGPHAADPASVRNRRSCSASCSA